MKELVIISGKGGTGKTSITASFAYLAKNKVLADCDVDAADLHLILEPKIKQKETFKSGKKAAIALSKCISCGKCNEVCVFGAVSFNDSNNKYIIDPIACEGCGVCYFFCPSGAITFKEEVCGQWFVSDTRFGPMVHAKLGIAAENSGKLVSLVRNKAKAILQEQNLDLILIDGPPGIGCPVIASITGADSVLIVTEPTLSGKHDLERITKLTNHFKIPTYVCVNKYDINPGITLEIENSAEELNIQIVGKIPYDNKVTKAQIAKKSIVEYENNTTSEAIIKLWHSLLSKINNTEKKK